MPLSDIQCKACEIDTHKIYVPLLQGELHYPPCDECGGPTQFLVTKAPSTDVLGCPVYDPVLDVEYSSTRDRDAQLRPLGWTPCGDAVGGDHRQEFVNWREKRPVHSYGRGTPPKV